MKAKLNKRARAKRAAAKTPPALCLACLSEGAVALTLEDLASGRFAGYPRVDKRFRSGWSRTCLDCKGTGRAPRRPG